MEDRNHGYIPLEFKTSAILACLHLVRLDEQLTLRMLYLTACNDKKIKRNVISFSFSYFPFIF